MSLLNSGLIRGLAAFALLLALWTGGDRINRNLAALDILQANVAGSDGTPKASKKLSPVWVSQARAAPARSNEASDIDSAFRGQAHSVEPLAEPDYAERLRPSVRIDGTSSQGVFIAGRYYPVGAPIAGLALHSETGQLIVPRVRSVELQTISLQVGGGTLVLRFGDGGWR